MESSHSFLAVSQTSLLLYIFFQDLRLMPKPCPSQTFPLDYQAVTSNSPCLKLHIITLPPVFSGVNATIADSPQAQNLGLILQRSLVPIPRELYVPIYVFEGVPGHCFHLCLLLLTFQPAFRASLRFFPSGHQAEFSIPSAFVFMVYSFCVLNIVSWLTLLRFHVPVF